jgi:hypothetical protein
MAKNELKASLRPLDGGAYTEVRLRGPVVSAPPPARALRRLFSQLAFWNGYLVHVVLSVDEQAGWLEPWADALAAVPERHLRIEFRRARGSSEQ